jgi:low affinity Fe/Cu permease
MKAPAKAHDPLCSAIEEIGTMAHVEPGFVRNCQCDLIARSREDERVAALRAAREAVVAIEQDPDAEVDYDRDYTADRSGNTRNARIWLREAVSAIEELGGRP